jgi:hypothetical protein
MNESTRSTLHFLLVLLGVCLLLAGTVMGVGLRDYDHHYAFEETSETIPDDWNEATNPMQGAEYDEQYAPYDELDDRERRIFEAAVEDGKRYTFQSQAQLPPTLVEKDGTYYVFAYTRSFDWTDPGMAGATLTLFGGFWLAFEGIRREQFPHVPVYRNLYRKVFGPFRRILQ